MTTIASLLPTPLDRAIAAVLPVAVAPKGGELEPVRFGQRLLIASDGIYIEAAHPALYVRQRVSAGTFPYGSTDECVTLPAGPIPRDLYDQLVAAALGAHPHEMAALVVLSADGYVLHRPKAVATAGSVRYDDHGYGDCPLVIDAHSHGHHAGYFSRTDDESDRSRPGPHLSLVFGRCAARATVEVCLRACVAGYLISLTPSTLRSLFA